MDRYLIEVAHDAERLAWAPAVQTFFGTGSHYLTHADRGCKDGDHRALMIVEAADREEARWIECRNFLFGSPPFAPELGLREEPGGDRDVESGASPRRLLVGAGEAISERARVGELALKRALECEAPPQPGQDRTLFQPSMVS